MNISANHFVFGLGSVELAARKVLVSMRLAAWVLRPFLVFCDSGSGFCRTIPLMSFSLARNRGICLLSVFAGAVLNRGGGFEFGLWGEQNHPNVPACTPYQQLEHPGEWTPIRGRPARYASLGVDPERAGGAENRDAGWLHAVGQADGAAAALLHLAPHG